MYVYSQTMPLEKHFTATKTFVVNHKKITTPGTIPKHWLEFSYKHSEDYELDHNFDDTKLKKQSEDTSNNKVKLFRETVGVIEK